MPWSSSPTPILCSRCARAARAATSPTEAEHPRSSSQRGTRHPAGFPGMRNTVEQRIAWDDLPGPLKQAIEARTGRIAGVRIATAGQNSPLAAIIDAADGTVFAKGMPSGHRRVITQAREAAVAPLVNEISPALLWHFDEAGWNVLGYEYAPGRHADYTPRSPDLDRLVRLMDALSAIKVPDDPGPFMRAEDR